MSKQNTLGAKPTEVIPTNGKSFKSISSDHERALRKAQGGLGRRVADGSSKLAQANEQLASKSLPSPNVIDRSGGQPGWQCSPKTFRQCSRLDVVIAFKIVGEEIRARRNSLISGRPTQAQVCELAIRIKDQRDLVRQISGRDSYKHARCLLRYNRRLRQRLIDLTKGVGLDPAILILR